MSWNSDSSTPSNPRIEDNVLKFEWSCARCGHDQTAVVKGDDIVNGTFVNCANVAVCGEGNSYVNFEGFRFGNACHIGPYDIPLNKPVAA